MHRKKIFSYVIEIVEMLCLHMKLISNHHPKKFTLKAIRVIIKLTEEHGIAAVL